MNVIMAGIDYKTAGVAVRERFSLTTAQVQELVARLAERQDVHGCVLLSTCNRTELYVSCTVSVRPAQMLCDALSLDTEQYVPCFTTRSGRGAVMHLMMVAAGLRSQIRGEDQILTQVKRAVDAARSAGACDNVLETLFRCAITAAKKVKTTVPLSPVESSVAQRAVIALQRSAGTLAGKKALVIGNGEMGRLVSALLVGQGCAVTVTLRSYKRGEAIVPQGCDTIPYDQRYGQLHLQDIVVSATTSPHHTIRLEEVRGCARIPHFWMDLAVPRDIDPAVAELPGISCWNVDTLGGATCESGAEKLTEAKRILEEYTRRFDAWRAHSALVPTIHEISRIAAERVEHTVLKTQPLAPHEARLAEQVIQQSVYKTVEMLLLGLGDTIDLDSLLECEQRLKV